MRCEILIFRWERNNVSYVHNKQILWQNIVNKKKRDHTGHNITECEKNGIIVKLCLTSMILYYVFCPIPLLIIYFCMTFFLLQDNTYMIVYDVW